jgi:hypothetical protein
VDQHHIGFAMTADDGQLFAVSGIAVGFAGQEDVKKSISRDRLTFS